LVGVLRGAFPVLVFFFFFVTHFIKVKRQIKAEKR